MFKQGDKVKVQDEAGAFVGMMNATEALIAFQGRPCERVRISLVEKL